ncbi:BQ2448_5713 [Microbotryum intermedium]|uniref:BQ2448_5713 protein n=1 Tax=Microbotryum intermedium TaxID=269621 RepID=A0A238F201_9BASI|nr:BQ2448_5713 [Microbotryum intermedium]
MSHADEGTFMSCWVPPTPQSTFVSVCDSAPGDGSNASDSSPTFELGLLPPPCLSLESAAEIKETRSDTMMLCHLRKPEHLTAVNVEQRVHPPLPESALANRGHADIHLLRNCIQDSGDWKLEDLPSQVERDRRLAEIMTTSSSSNLRKRPRRGAAIEAARKLPKAPSPFDSDLDEDPSSSSATTPRRRHGPRLDTQSSSNSKRKISHSLIERRRRERINECLSQLKRLVPQCREYGEEKRLRARERGRNRVRANEALEDGSSGIGASGLHKLEILQGTILYISELQSRIQHLEQRNTGMDLSMASPPSQATPSSLLDLNVACRCNLPGTAATDHLDAATLLLKFSTSPELRPVSI